MIANVLACSLQSPKACVRKQKRKSADTVSESCLRFVQHWFYKHQWPGLRVRSLCTMAEKTWSLSEDASNHMLPPVSYADENPSLGTAVVRFCNLIVRSNMNDDDVYNFFDILSPVA